MYLTKNIRPINSLALIKCHDCSKFLCTDCREPHLRETFYSVSASVGQLRHILPNVSDKIADYEQRTAIIKTNYEQIRREITLAVATLIDELKQREAVLFTEAEAYMQSQLRYTMWLAYSFLSQKNYLLERFACNEKLPRPN